MEEEVDYVLDVLNDVLSVLLLLSLVSFLLFLDLLFDFFADFFIFQVDLDSFFAFHSKDLQLDHFLTLTKFETKFFFL